MNANMKSLPINELYLFCKVVQASGFKQAAATIEPSAATLSRAVASLERKLGDKLLQRHAKKFQLTAFGQKMYSQFSVQLADIELDYQKISESGRELSGNIKISCPEPLMLEFLHEWLMQFMQLHPEVSIETRFSFVGENLVEQNIDLAMVIGEPQHNSMIQKQVLIQPLWLVASNQYLQQQPPINQVSDLTVHQILDSGIRDSWYFDENNKEVKFLLKPKYKVANMTLLINAALNHQGITLAPAFSVHKYLEDNRLTRVLPQLQAKKNGVYLLYKDRKLMPTRVHVLKDFILEKMAGLNVSNIHK